MLTADQETLQLQAGRYLRPVKFTRIDKRRWRVNFAYSKELVAEIKSMEGARWHPDGKYWTISDSERNRFALRLLTGERTVWDETPAPITDRSTRPLYEHQWEMVSHVLHKRRFLLIGEQGVGKTLAMIEAMERSDTDDWLVVGPRSALHAWRREIDRWGCNVAPRFSTYESLHKILEAGGDPPRGVIFDESSRIKTPSAARSRSARKLAESMISTYPDSAYVVAMTGTPSPNNPLDWWHQAEVVCPGWLREGSLKKLEQRMAIYSELQLPTGVVRRIVGWKENEVECLGRRLRGLVETWRKDDCLDLPAKVYDVWTVEPSDEYREAASLIVDGAETAISALTQLRQLSDGFIGGTRFPCPKEDLVDDLLEQYDEDGRVVIFAAFHDSMDRVRERCLLAGWDVVQYDGRSQTIHTAVDGPAVLSDPIAYFQDGGARRVAFVGHPQAAGLGLTLTRSQVIAYYSNTFSAEDRLQSEDRIHRPGMRGARIIDFVHLPSDEMVTRKLRAKERLQSLSVDSIREALKS